jgi:hypothetical protein
MGKQSSYSCGNGLFDAGNRFIHSHLNFLHPICFRNRVLIKIDVYCFFNYIEMVFAFAVLYSCDNYLNKPFTHWFDAIYFSTTTSSTIGFGDFYPVKTFGRF